MDFSVVWISVGHCTLYPAFPVLLRAICANLDFHLPPVTLFSCFEQLYRRNPAEIWPFWYVCLILTISPRISPPIDASAKPRMAKWIHNSSELKEYRKSWEITVCIRSSRELLISWVILCRSFILLRRELILCGHLAWRLRSPGRLNTIHHGIISGYSNVPALLLGFRHQVCTTTILTRNYPAVFMIYPQNHTSTHTCQAWVSQHCTISSVKPLTEKQLSSNLQVWATWNGWEVL